MNSITHSPTDPPPRPADPPVRSQDRFILTARHIALQLDIEEAMWQQLRGESNTAGRTVRVLLGQF